jgi:hypothetical protein
VVAETVEIPQETPSTSGSFLSTSESSDTSSNQQLVFQFPEPGSDQFSTIDIGFLTEVSDFNDVTFVEETTETDSLYSSASSCTVPFSPTSPSYSTVPPTPDTASSLDSSSSNIPSFVKEGLKFAIKSKREKQGKGDLKVEFVPPPPEQVNARQQFLFYCFNLLSSSL